MTTSADLLDDFEVTDWTTLDYASVSHPIFPDFTFKGSIFQQIVNSRHLPLLFTYRSFFTPKTRYTPEPKLDYSQTSEFYSAIETRLLSSTGNVTCSSSTTGQFLVAYADGSCPSTRTVGPDNPAGWGFTTYTSNSPFQCHSPVEDR